MFSTTIVGKFHNEQILILVGFPGGTVVKNLPAK